MNIRTITSLILVLVVVSIAFGQRRVAITIDDIPNTRKLQRNNFETRFLTTLDSLNIPVAIFLNEGFI